MSEEPGLLGNLPRSRPGHRSAKRADAPPKRAPTPRDSAARAQDADGDPVGDALRAAARTAEAGMRAANDVTREILRRLPRP